jgi:hypothetical protein
LLKLEPILPEFSLKLWVIDNGCNWDAVTVSYPVASSIRKQGRAIEVDLRIRECREQDWGRSDWDEEE